jgi:hypothetical protein
MRNTPDIKKSIHNSLPPIFSSPYTFLRHDLVHSIYMTKYPNPNPKAMTPMSKTPYLCFGLPDALFEVAVAGDPELVAEPVGLGVAPPTAVARVVPFETWETSAPA